MAVFNTDVPARAAGERDTALAEGVFADLRALPDWEEPRIAVKPVPYAAAKRALDVTLALLGLVLCAPLMALIALAVKLSSRGPALFQQTRVGVGGSRFTCYKFRSMYADAEQQRRHLLARNEVSGPVFKIKRDPRMTPLGRVLRKFSLDELPQLVNVLKGEMSIVGPRPPIPAEVCEYNAKELGRLSVKPGLTCLWQINGRSTVGFAEWVEMDLRYIETMSFWQDLAIIARTLPAVISTRGAY